MSSLLLLLLLLSWLLYYIYKVEARIFYLFNPTRSPPLPSEYITCAIFYFIYTHFIVPFRGCVRTAELRNPVHPAHPLTMQLKSPKTTVRLNWVGPGLIIIIILRWAPHIYINWHDIECVSLGIIVMMVLPRTLVSSIVRAACLSSPSVVQSPS